jgi:6-pyruvoyltetrahydropterin/6-carboxytetrahydropterin synthase
MIFVTHSYGFPAAHVLAQPAFSDDENRRIFGKCANPAGHGHDYRIEVTLSGPVDEESGQIINPGTLDEIFNQTIDERYSHRMLNDVPPFGALVPTAENIAIVIHEQLGAAVARRSTAEVARVRVIETQRNHVEYGEIA